MADHLLEKFKDYEFVVENYPHLVEVAREKDENVSLLYVAVPKEVANPLKTESMLQSIVNQDFRRKAFNKEGDLLCLFTESSQEIEAFAKYLVENTGSQIGVALGWSKDERTSVLENMASRAKLDLENVLKGNKNSYDLKEYLNQ